MIRIARLLAGTAAALITVQAMAGAVVAGKDAPLGNIQSDEAKKIFLGRESSVGGHDIQPIYQKIGASPRADFDGKVLDKPSADLAGYWSKLVFTGRATTVPKEVGDDGEMKKTVNSTPGAVGYISDAAVDDSVKVLLKY
jgi:ABC-type phosphate transport system substrate-binding protein